MFIVGAKNGGSPAHRKRLACYRVGCEARVSDLKRRGLRRSRLKGVTGVHAWSSWTCLTHNSEGWSHPSPVAGLWTCGGLFFVLGRNDPRPKRRPAFVRVK